MNGWVLPRPNMAAGLARFGITVGSVRGRMALGRDVVDAVIDASLAITTKEATDIEQERIQLNYAFGLSLMQEIATAGGTAHVETLPDGDEPKMNDPDTEESSSVSGYSNS